MGKKIKVSEMNSSNYYLTQEDDLKNPNNQFLIIKIHDDLIERYFDKRQFIIDCDLDEKCIDDYSICFIIEEYDTINETIIYSKQFLAISEDEEIIKFDYPISVKNFYSNYIIYAKYMNKIRKYKGINTKKPYKLQRIVQIDKEESNKYMNKILFMNDCNIKKGKEYDICICLEEYDTINRTIDSTKKFLLVEEDERVFVIL